MGKDLSDAVSAYRAYYNRGLVLNPKSNYDSQELINLARRYETNFHVKEQIDKEFLELAIRHGFTYETEQEFEEGD